MWVKGRSPAEIVLSLLNRSSCHVQVASILMDRKNRLVAHGWNHAGRDGFGEHSEVMCLKRANPARVSDSILWVAARRRKSGSIVTARPCAACAPAVRECAAVRYRDGSGQWRWFK